MGLVIYLMLQLNLVEVAVAKRVMLVSDLTGDIVEDADHVSIKVLDAPTLESPVRLDASEAEVKDLSASAADYVVLEVLRQSGTDRMVVELDKFEKLFKGDMQEALEGAEPVVEEARPRRRRGRPPGAAAKPSAGQKPKRDKAQIQAIRDWWRSQGNEISDRGRIPFNVEEAYNAAHTA
jgi:Lsr2